jgi:hypothetical protein
VTPPIPGLWRMDAAIPLTPTASGQWVQCILMVNNSPLTYGMQHSSGTIWTLASAFLLRQIVVGDYMTCAASSSVSMSANTAAWNFHMTCSYIGTG